MKNTILVGSAAILLTIIAITLLQIPKWRLYNVQTASMGQAVSKGSLVLVRRTTEQLPIGAVGSYRHPLNPKMVVTHRVIAFDSRAETYVFKGDKNQSDDVPVAASRVVGQVTHVIPYAGYVCGFLKTPIGLLVGVYLPASLVIIYEISRLAYLKKSYRLNT